MLFQHDKYPDFVDQFVQEMIIVTFYIGTLIVYRHIVFKLEKVYMKNCAHKQSNMCRPPKGGGWGGLKQNFRL